MPLLDLLREIVTQPVEPQENRWVPVVEDLQRQVYYRQLGLVSMHGPVYEVVAAAAWLAERGMGGDVFWTTPGAVARWEGVEVYPGIFMNEWLYGGPRNTVLMRVGFWKLNLTRAARRLLELG